MRLFRENIAAACLVLSVLALSVWLQFWHLDDFRPQTGGPAEDEMDYYMENVTMTGMDARGDVYRITSDRLEHFPAGDRTRIANPLVTRYDQAGSPQDISADSGWLDGIKKTVLLLGNVRVTQNRADGPDAASTSQKMMIRLDERDD